MKSLALLFSGGMDSYIAYYYFSLYRKDEKGRPEFDVKPIYINYHGEYCEKEMEIAKELLPQTVIVDSVINLGKWESGDKRYIPNRNLFLATIAANFADQVAMAGLKDDNVGDKSAKFCALLSETLSESMGRKILVDSPFWHMEKARLVEWFFRVMGKAKGSELLQKTTYCYDKSKTYCGYCPSCFRKACAFAFNDIYLPFYNKSLMLDYYDRRYKYPATRFNSIVKICKHYNLI